VAVARGAARLQQAGDRPYGGPEALVGPSSAKNWGKSPTTLSGWRQETGRKPRTLSPRKERPVDMENLGLYGCSALARSLQGAARGRK